MTIRLQEVVRSEVEGGLAGPANPIPNQSIDCGCSQLPCPKLARFATRRLFVGLLSWVGFVQAAAYAYFYISGSTIARTFQFDPHIIEWIMVLPDLTPFLFGILVAYWGDRIHRVAWIGGIVLVQSVSYFIMIIPHLTHQTKVIEETTNVTHMSIYAEDSRELCSETSSRIIGKEDEPCYLTFAVMVVVQIINGIANIAYFTLGISYLDDNTKKRHVTVYVGVLIAAKIVGILLGCILAWTCLRIDSNTLIPIESHREQIGAWWLGLPILTLLLIVPGLLLSWFPRMLPSQVVEKAAASLLKNSNDTNRAPRRLISHQIGSPNFWPSMGRLIVNKTLICQILASTLYITAILNFMGYENLIAQSRFQVPKPTGTLLGFEDPISVRLISNILKPILVGLIVIITGLVVSRAKPSGKFLISYSIVVIVLAAGIVFALIAASCTTMPIVGGKDNTLQLLQYCNRNCQCSKDADFRPVCDSKGKYTFYSACHAGCGSSETKNGIKTYGRCSCVAEIPELNGTSEAIDGPCNSNSCEIGWIIFEFATLFIYTLVASSFVGDLLIILRSVNAQDKAIAIGFWMTCSAIVVNVPGKILYDLIASLTCRYWGSQRTMCHLHDDAKLADYLYYLTGSLLTLSALFKIIVLCLCKDLNLYSEKEEETSGGTEMQELIRVPLNSTTEEQRGQNDGTNDDSNTVQVEIRKETSPKSSSKTVKQDGVDEVDEPPLKYGPMGPGNRRSSSKSSLDRKSENRKSVSRGLDSEDDLSSSDDGMKKDSSPKVAYRPLDLDSDVESELSNVEPRSRRRVVSKDYDRIYSNDENQSAKNSLRRREFPNPDNYDDPRLSRRMDYNKEEDLDGSSKTNSFEFTRKRQENAVQKRGDFNEIGIPIMDHPTSTNASKNGVKSLIDKYESNSESVEDKGSVRLGDNDGKVVSGIPLVAMASKRPSPKGQSMDNRLNEVRPESRESVSPKTSSKGSVGTLHTDF